MPDPILLDSRAHAASTVASRVARSLKIAASRDVMEGGLRVSASKRRGPRSYSEVILTDKKGGPSIREHTTLLKAMIARYPDQLKHTAVYLGQYNPKETYKRNWENPRGSAIQKGLGAILRAPGKNSGPSQYDGAGPFYDPGADAVYAPWNSSGASMHELGHAVDMNTTAFSGKAPDNVVMRQIKGVPRDLYNASYVVSPLWHEHAAWRTGRKGLLEGGAMTGTPWKKIEPIIRSSGHAKGPALGSYWGAGIGTAAGIAGGVALYRAGVPGAAASVLMGAMGGTLIGMGVGAKLRNRFKERYVENARLEYEGLEETMGPKARSQKVASHLRLKTSMMRLRIKSAVRKVASQPTAEELAQFRKGTASEYNPNSWLDRNKMQQMQSQVKNWGDNASARSMGQQRPAAQAPISNRPIAAPIQDIPSPPPFSNPAEQSQVKNWGDNASARSMGQQRPAAQAPISNRPIAAPIQDIPSPPPFSNPAEQISMAGAPDPLPKPVFSGLPNPPAGPQPAIPPPQIPSTQSPEPLTAVDEFNRSRAAGPRLDYTRTMAPGADIDRARRSIPLSPPSKLLAEKPRGAPQTSYTFDTPQGPVIGGDLSQTSSAYDDIINSQGPPMAGRSTMPMQTRGGNPGLPGASPESMAMEDSGKFRGGFNSISGGIPQGNRISARDGVVAGNPGGFNSEQIGNSYMARRNSPTIVQSKRVTGADPKAYKPKDIRSIPSADLKAYNPNAPKPKGIGSIPGAAPKAYKPKDIRSTPGADLKAYNPNA